MSSVGLPPSMPTNINVDANIQNKTVKINDMELTMENGMLPMLGIFCSSVILLIATTTNDSGEMRNSMKGYANSVAAISMILSFTLLAKIKQIEAYSIFIRYFQFVWSFVGGCILTFGSGPFSKTGNGYFCLWAMVIFSFLSMGVKFDSLKGAVQENATPIVGLGFCSFLVLLSTLSYFGTQFHWQSVFALIVSLITIFAVGYFLVKFQKNSKLPNQAFNIMVAMSMLWIFVAGVTTFSGPFLVTGNGYFSVWAGAIMSVVACKEAYQDDGIENVEEPPSPVLASPRAGEMEMQSEHV